MTGYAPVYFRAEKSGLLSALVSSFLEQEGLAAALSPTELIPLGAVYVNTRRALHDREISAGDLVKVFPSPKRYPMEALREPVSVLFENEDFMVVDKPAPLPVHAVSSNAVENLLVFLERKRGEKLYVTSRLDVDTTGLLLLAKSCESQTAINALFHAGKVEKIYRCVTEAAPPLGLITHYQSTRKGVKKLFLRERMAAADKECRLVVKSADPTPKRFLCTIQLLSGRTHQIRGQLALLGCPILGDELYGPTKRNHALQLECLSLAFSWKGRALHFERSRKSFGTTPTSE
jgi:23S rRNA-/tRNA-specific pseudouridylate synthase